MRALSLCMIARDEEANLPRVLSSVQDLVDEIVIVDTGSTDRTVEVASSFGARIGHFTWIDDFAAARNFSLSLARGEWALVLDADDEFERADISMARERMSSTSADGLSARQTVTHPNRSPVIKEQLAFFRITPGRRYLFRIHERLNIDPARVERTPIRIIHHGYTAETLPKKLDRDRRLLHRMKADEPPVARVAASFYLGALAESEDGKDEAYREYKAAAYSAVECDFRLYAVLGLARLALERGEIEYSGRLYEIILQSNPGAVEAELGLAGVSIRKGDYRAARDHLVRAEASSFRILPARNEAWEAEVRARVRARPA